MSKRKFGALPEAARNAISAVVGETEGKIFGAFFDRQAAREREALIQSGKHTFLNWTPAQLDAWKIRLAPLEDEWIRSVPNGENILRAYREYAASADSQ